PEGPPLSIITNDRPWKPQAMHPSRACSLETICAHAREACVGGPPPLTAPIFQSAVWQLESIEQCEAINRKEAPGFIYTRDANPNPQALEALVARLEGAESALVTASGMGAIAVALLTAAGPGDHVVADESLYGASTRLLAAELGRCGVETSFVPSDDATAVGAALRPKTRAVLVET